MESVWRRARPDSAGRTSLPTPSKRAELRGKISAVPSLDRFLHVTPAACAARAKPRSRPEENLDGKYLLRWLVRLPSGHCRCFVRPAAGAAVAGGHVAPGGAASQGREARAGNRRGDATGEYYQDTQNVFREQAYDDGTQWQAGQFVLLTA